MARANQTRGRCVFCNREMTRGGLAKHLKTCLHVLAHARPSIPMDAVHSFRAMPTCAGYLTSPLYASEKSHK